MRAWIVNSKEDIKEHYFYKKSEPKLPADIRFPCVMIEYDNDGGLMGQHYSYSYKMPPVTVESKLDWLNGFLAGARAA